MFERLRRICFGLFWWHFSFLVGLGKALVSFRENSGSNFNIWHDTQSKKCEFGRATVDFLGFWIGLGRIEHTQRKVHAILEFKRQDTKKQLQWWFGLASFQKCLSMYVSVVIAPTDMLRKTVRFKRTPQTEDAFNEIKRVASRPILTPTDFHVIDGEHTICIISQKLNKRQISMLTIEIEAFSLFNGGEKI